MSSRRKKKVGLAIPLFSARVKNEEDFVKVYDHIMDVAEVLIGQGKVVGIEQFREDVEEKLLERGISGMINPIIFDLMLVFSTDEYVKTAKVITGGSSARVSVVMGIDVEKYEDEDIGKYVLFGKDDDIEVVFCEDILWLKDGKKIRSKRIEKRIAVGYDDNWEEIYRPIDKTYLLEIEDERRERLILKKGFNISKADFSSFFRAS